jgi:hypothetical protein
VELTFLTSNPDGTHYAVALVDTKGRIPQCQAEAMYRHVNGQVIIDKWYDPDMGYYCGRDA